LRAEGFSFSLEVLFGFFSAVFFQFLVIKTPVPDPDLDSLEMLDPNPQPGFNDTGSTKLLVRGFFFSMGHSVVLVLD